MKKFTIAFTAVMAIALLLTWISVAYAEEEAVPLIDTCFIGNYSAGWNEDTSNRDVVFTGKLSSTVFNGGCSSEGSLELEGKTVNVIALQSLYNGYEATTTISPFQVVFSFPDGTEYGDVGEWFITYSFDGYDEYASSAHVFTIIVPAHSEEEEVDIPLETIPEEDFVEVNATGGVEYDVETGEPLVETETIEVVSTQSPADNETLNLRLEILKVLENILAILFGK